MSPISMKPEGVGDAVDLNSGSQSPGLDNSPHSSSYAFRLLSNLNSLRSSPNNNLCDVEIVAGKGEYCRMISST